MDNDTLLSIIIPVYNLENYIENCLNSLINQVKNNVEIIIINDGSKDRSEEICQSYSVKYSYIRYYKQKNGGVSNARNNGVKQAKGKYILFVDGDDWLLPNSLPEIMTKLKANDFDLICGDFIKVYEQLENYKKNIKNKNSISIIEKEKYPKNIINLFNSGYFKTNLWCNFFKRSIVLENNIKFDENVKYTEDLDYLLNILFNCQTVGLMDNPFYAYRQSRDGSATSFVSKKRVEDNFDFIKKWYKFYEACDLDKQIKSYLINFLSYEYTIVLGLLFLLPKDEFNQMYKSVYDFKWILKNNANKKVKIVSIVEKVIGFNNTGKLLAKFIKSKK